MRLLVVTDHTYYAGPDGVYDTFCFDRAFFDDYRAVFDEVRVMARMRGGEVPAHARRADGDGVEFVPLPDWTGFRWMLGLPLRYRGFIKRAVAECDAVCLRLPSVSGDVAFGLARRLGKPVMFELIGDMEAALNAGLHGALTRRIGRWNTTRVREITRTAVAGSYVSRRHLQERFPPGPRTVHDAISSIRLPASAILPSRRFDTAPQPLRLVLVASMVRVKDHETLLRGVAAARRRGAALTLDLAGDGPLRTGLEQLAGELGIADCVTFHGHVTDHARRNALLDASDLFVMSSVSEGMPRALIEAMTRGLPAVGSATGGIAEILTAGQTFPVGDWQRLGEILASLSNDPARLTAWARHSEATAREFSQEILSAKRRRLLTVLRAAAQR